MLLKDCHHSRVYVIEFGSPITGIAVESIFVDHADMSRPEWPDYWRYTLSTRLIHLDPAGLRSYPNTITSAELQQLTGIELPATAVFAEWEAAIIEVAHQQPGYPPYMDLIAPESC
ncbi:MAG: hypothetical protein JXA33_24970 [Anaerolineae bacterium]|nr:hypothetical protein [Anaerolineae bacterium]